MLGFLSSPTFSNIFFPQAEDIPDLKNASYEALFHPLLNSFINTLTGAFPDLPKDLSEAFHMLVQSIFRDNFARTSCDFIKYPEKDITSLNLIGLPFSLVTTKITIDREIKMRSDSLIESMFLQPLYEAFSDSSELLRIHGLNVINVSGTKNVILDPCCDVTVAEFEGRNSRWTHLVQYRDITPDKPVPEKPTSNKYIKQVVDNIKRYANLLLLGFSNKLKSIINDYTLEYPVPADPLLYFSLPEQTSSHQQTTNPLPYFPLLEQTSLYQQAFEDFFVDLLAIIDRSIEQINCSENASDLEYLHSFVSEGDIQFLRDLRK
jgi:hypothetical protein